VTEVIDSMLKDRSFISCKALCKRFHTAKTRRSRVLCETLGMKKFNIRWVSSVVATNRNAEGPNLSHGLSVVFQVTTWLISRMGSVWISYSSFCTLWLIR
jgi:hypothetical protein